jgi:hypothetical protein
MLPRTLKQGVSRLPRFLFNFADSIDVGEDVENCVLRLLQAAEYDINRTE